MIKEFCEKMKGKSFCDDCNDCSIGEIIKEHNAKVRTEAIKPIQKFIDDYDGAIIISENMGVINGQQLINELKEIVEQLKGEEK